MDPMRSCHRHIDLYDVLYQESTCNYPPALGNYCIILYFNISLQFTFMCTIPTGYTLKSFRSVACLIASTFDVDLPTLRHVNVHGVIENRAF